MLQASTQHKEEFRGEKSCKTRSYFRTTSKFQWELKIYETLCASTI